MSLEGSLTIDVSPDAVSFEFTVVNGGTDPVELTFRSGKIADIAVYADGGPVWRWSDGRMFTQALRTDSLAPGESFTHAAEWVDPEPGEYTAEATLEATNHELPTRRAFVVEG